MQHFNVNQKQQQGFTLLEMIVVTIMIGILAAIGIPNFLGWLQQNRLNRDVAKFKGALQRTQEEAMRRNEVCGFEINWGDNDNNGENDPNYFVQGDRDNDGDNDDNCRSVTRELEYVDNLELVEQDTDPRNDGQQQFNFDFRGNINLANPEQTIRFGNDDVNEDLCIRIFEPLGIIREGVMNDANECVPPENA